MNIQKVIIEVIPHSNQRYETPGDWFFEDGGKTLIIRVSQLQDHRQEMLIAVHELVEVLLCLEKGVTQKEVDDFDVDFEANRPKGNLDEPGDDFNSPYRDQHCFATAVERMLCAALGIAWSDYEKACNDLLPK